MDGLRIARATFEKTRETWQVHRKLWRKPRGAPRDLTLDFAPWRHTHGKKISSLLLICSQTWWLLGPKVQLSNLHGAHI